MKPWTLRAIGVDKIHIGKDRTKHSAEKFLALIGEQVAGKVEFVGSNLRRRFCGHGPQIYERRWP